MDMVIKTVLNIIQTHIHILTNMDQAMELKEKKRGLTMTKVDLDLIESFVGCENGTIPKNGTQQKSQEKQK